MLLIYQSFCLSFVPYYNNLFNWYIVVEIQVSEVPNAGTYTIDHELMKIMITVFSKVVKLTEEMFHTKDIRGM